MGVLSVGLRKVLERGVVAGRGVAEGAAVAALSRLGVTLAEPPSYLDADEAVLWEGLRARAQQLGDTFVGGVADGAVLLVGEVAYEQWHRLLFARVLAENDLLIHPEYGAPVSLQDCADLAAGLAEPDAWSVAARFASAILPGIFRVEDPTVRVQFAPEDRLALEKIVTGLPVEVFTADDALGWVYQYWQTQQKKTVNDSGRKIGGADIAPVTQLFTEDYMVRFLLENSLGAWWAARFPHSPLIAGWEYLRFDEGGAPAAGSFEGWPATVAEVTVMDPCCGSGHFLVAAFGMLWRMRAEAEGLSPAAAQDAVLRENLFGLELDPRCTQIAMFNLALEAWKQGGYRTLPVPNVACSGIPAKAPLAEWLRLADGDEVLEYALTELHTLFRDADTLGSLIDPRKALDVGPLESIGWHSIAPMLKDALTVEGIPAAAVFGSAAADTAHAADLLSRNYALVVTNPPYLGRGSQTPILREFCLTNYKDANPDLATAVAARALEMSTTSALVLPHNWLFTSAFTALRRNWLAHTSWHLLARLGSGAFTAISGEVVQVALWIVSTAPHRSETYGEVDASRAIGIAAKSAQLRIANPIAVSRQAQLANPSSVVMIGGELVRTTLADTADVRPGLMTGDAPVFIRMFWEPEPDSLGQAWKPLRSAPGREDPGARLAILWEEEAGRLAAWANSVSHLNHAAQGWRRGKPLWGQQGIAVKMMGDMNIALYGGEPYDASVAVIVPWRASDLPALWAFATTGGLESALRQFHSKLSIESGTILSVPFDVERWRAVAEVEFPDGLPEPFSDDPSQWLFKGVVAGSSEPLQVAVARLLGFSWPDQEPDALDGLADADGIVCLPPVSGEASAADRLRALLASAYAGDWSLGKLDELLVAAGGKQGDLEGWLRDVFFKHHTKVFQNRPFIWHVWDGRADGFSALINYHRLDRQTLQKLTYTTLGWWIQKQSDDAANGVAGAAARLGAAQQLREKLVLILEGEPPYDLYVRWKSLVEQPIGWDPDLDDGVRLNIRPFVQAGILRSKFTINWNKDRGTNPDGTTRENDIHLTIAAKHTARGTN